MPKNIESFELKKQDISSKDIDFIQNYASGDKYQKDDFGFAEKEREEKAEKRKELLDKVLVIDNKAKEKLNILDDIYQNGKNSKYVGENSFPKKITFLLEQKDQEVENSEYCENEEKIKEINEKIKNIDIEIENVVDNYFLGENNIQVKDLISITQERLLKAHKNIGNELQEKGIEWKDVPEEERIKMLDKRHLDEQEAKDEMKEILEKTEKEKSEKDEFFVEIISIREDIYKTFSSLDGPFEKIHDAKKMVRKKSEKEMMDYVPDIIKATSENEIEKAVKKMYITSGRKGSKMPTGREEALVCSDLTGIDIETIKNIIQRAYPVWLSQELITEIETDNRPEYYRELKDKYREFLDRFRFYFNRFVKNDEEKIDKLTKSCLRGNEAKEAFEISERVEAFKEKLCNREILGVNLKDIYTDVRSPKEGDLMAMPSPERMDWLVEPMLVYYDSQEDFAYTDKEVLSGEVKNRLEERIGYRSQSRRCFFIINEDETITEFKGYSPANLNKRKIVESSGAPEGILDASEGIREKAVLNNIGSVEADFKLVKEKCKNVAGKEMDYGILKRKGKKEEEFTPFLRIATPNNIIDKMSEYKKISAAEFIGQSAKIFAKELGNLHKNGVFDGADYEDGKYKSWLHASNVEIHGHIIDVGATSTIDRMAQEEFEPNNLEHLKLLTTYKAKDLDRFFGGNREVSNTKDTGYYDVKLKKTPEFSKEFIGSFLEIYLRETSNNERKKVFDDILREIEKNKKWTEKISHIIAEAHTIQQYIKKISKE